MKPTTVLCIALVICVVYPGCDSSTGGRSKSAGQTESDASQKERVIQFSDDFSPADEGSDDFNKLWTTLKNGQSRIENGHWFMDVLRGPPPGPGADAQTSVAVTKT